MEIERDEVIDVPLLLASRIDRSAKATSSSSYLDLTPWP